MSENSIMSDKLLKDAAMQGNATPLEDSRHEGRRAWPRWRLGLTLAFVASMIYIRPLEYLAPTTKELQNKSALCPQVPALNPRLQSELLSKMTENLTSDAYREATIRRLSGAIAIQTTTYDDMGRLDEDPRWEVFTVFADYLRNTFPMVHDNLKLEKINTHGLLYTWTGSDLTLKPTVLMAHQDVVPVPDSTVSQWEQGPFSGSYDGSFIWGRGALDCKNTLVASLEAVEALLSAGFQPRRTVILSFGFDEEISGHHGAAFLASHLMERYGQDGVGLIMDEGAPILPLWGTHFALPGVSEKGYVDVEIIVRSSGGHSSMPPVHTSAGIAAELVSIIENTPYPPLLHDENPLLDFLWCGAEHAPNFVPGLRHLLPRRGVSGILETAKKWLLPRIVSHVSSMAQYLMMTTQAVDVLHGGLKVNALPERTRILINHRVNVGETSEVIMQKLTKLAGTVAARHNLTLHAFDDAKEEPSSISVHFEGRILEPAPVTPTMIRRDQGDTPWSIVAGTTKALYGNKVVLAPGIMPANTDTKYYWNLSRHIFRYFPGWDPEVLSLEGIHTVNERVSVVAHMKTIEWYVQFLRNVDEATML